METKSQKTAGLINLLPLEKLGWLLIETAPKIIPIFVTTGATLLILGLSIVYTGWGK